MNLNDVLKTHPVVFAVDDCYQIMVPVNKETLMWVKVGERCYYDASNGTLRSAEPIHRMVVPKEALDEAKSYTLCYRVVLERKPYFTETEEEVNIEYAFSPVPDGNVKAFFLADAHNEENSLIKSAKAFEEKYGAIDFLILGGDMPNDSGVVENFFSIFVIASAITKGKKPVVNARGNHDLRGICAERMERYLPAKNGNFYYTFRLGSIWGIILDCGEDKNDDHPEYGHTVACHDFRLQETEFIKNVIKNADDEYLAKGVIYRLVVSHVAFFNVLPSPFDLEQDVYKEWCALLKENIQPDFMVSGHIHNVEVLLPEGTRDDLGQPCKAILGSRPYQDDKGIKHFFGTGLFFENGTIRHVFIDDGGNVR